MTTAPVTPLALRPLLQRLLGDPAVPPADRAFAEAWGKRLLTDPDCRRSHVRLLTELTDDIEPLAESLDAGRALAIATNGLSAAEAREIALIMLSPDVLGDLTDLAADIRADWWFDEMALVGKSWAEDAGIGPRSEPPKPPANLWGYAAIGLSLLTLVLVVVVVAVAPWRAEPQVETPALPAPTDSLASPPLQDALPKRPEQTPPIAPPPRLKLESSTPALESENVIRLAALKRTAPAISRSPGELEDYEPFEYQLRVQTRRAVGLLFRVDSMTVNFVGRLDQKDGVIDGVLNEAIGPHRGAELFVLVLTDDPTDAERRGHLSGEDLRAMQVTEVDRQKAVRDSFDAAFRSGEKPWSGSPADIVFLEVRPH